MKFYSVQAIFFCSFIIASLACGPGRSGGRRRNARKMTPLVYKQYSPNLSENTMIASGPSEGRITRNDQRYKDLVPNYNPDILFRDIEGTGASRLMTQRLKEKLDILSISVMNQWPGVRLRVLKGWDEQNFHALHSLHYEGRAVDLSTSDRDRTKNGMLARLAIQAGFDWVFYESRYHIHASVKSEKTHSLRPEGCFLGTSYVQTKMRGMTTIDQLDIGEEVLAINNENKLVYSKVLMFLDLDAYAKKLYYFIKTETNSVIALTESHLIFVSDSPNKPAEVDYAAFIKPGMYIFVPEQSVLSRNGEEIVHSNYTQELKVFNNNENDRIKLVKVIDVQSKIKSGAFAPLTSEGTILVDGVVASCYAHIINQSLAHLGFLPVRLLDIFLSSLSSLRNNYLGKSERLDELSKSESITIKNENKKPIKVDRRVVNSKIINLIDTKKNTTVDNLQYDLHQSFKPQQGIHWYAYFLYYLAKLIIPADYMYH